MTPADLEKYHDRLYPLCRSLAGPGFNESLDILSDLVPFERLRFRTGQRIFDWTVPPEWLPRDSYIRDPNGFLHCRFKIHNLHLMSYSAPFQGRLSLAELQPHLHSKPDQPGAIPYCTSYYSRDWGLCLSHREREALPDGEYDVFVGTEFKDGNLIVAEATLPGETPQEVWFTSYLCHPSMSQNELTGPLVLAALYQRIAAWPRRTLTYKFLLWPETIGALCYLDHRRFADYPKLAQQVVAGYVLTCLGITTHMTYKQSRQGKTVADRAAIHVLASHPGSSLWGWDPVDGSDERQMCSPGFNLPVGCLMKGTYREYPQYHTSADNRLIIDFDHLRMSVDVAEDIAALVDANALRVRRVSPYGEPFLSQHGLYPVQGGQHLSTDQLQAMMWMLNLVDDHDLITMAERSGIPWQRLVVARDRAIQAGLVR